MFNINTINSASLDCSTGTSSPSCYLSADAMQRSEGSTRACSFDADALGFSASPMLPLSRSGLTRAIPRLESVSSSTLPSSLLGLCPALSTESSPALALATGLFSPALPTSLPAGYSPDALSASSLALLQHKAWLLSPGADTLLHDPLGPMLDPAGAQADSLLKLGLLQQRELEIRARAVGITDVSFGASSLGCAGTGFLASLPGVETCVGVLPGTKLVGVDRGLTEAAQAVMMEPVEGSVGAAVRLQMLQAREAELQAQVQWLREQQMSLNNQLHKPKPERAVQAGTISALDSSEATPASRLTTRIDSKGYLQSLPGHALHEISDERGHTEALKGGRVLPRFPLSGLDEIAGTGYAPLCSSRDVQAGPPASLRTLAQLPVQGSDATLLKTASPTKEMSFLGGAVRSRGLQLQKNALPDPGAERGFSLRSLSEGTLRDSGKCGVGGPKSTSAGAHLLGASAQENQFLLVQLGRVGQSKSKTKRSLKRKLPVTKVNAYSTISQEEGAAKDCASALPSPGVPRKIPSMSPVSQPFPSSPAHSWASARPLGDTEASSEMAAPKKEKYSVQLDLDLKL